MFEVNDWNRAHLKVDAIVSQTATDRANIAIANTGSRLVYFDWHIYIKRWSIVEVKKVEYILTENISQMVTDRTDITIATLSCILPFHWHIYI